MWYCVPSFVVVTYLMCRSSIRLVLMVLLFVCRKSKFPFLDPGILPIQLISALYVCIHDYGIWRIILDLKAMNFISSIYSTFPNLSVLRPLKEKVAVRSYLGTLNSSPGRFIALTQGGVSPSEAPMLIFCIPTSRISYLYYRNRVTAMSCTPKSSMASSRTPLQVTTPRFWLLGESCSSSCYFPVKFWISIFTKFIRIPRVLNRAYLHT